MRSSVAAVQTRPNERDAPPAKSRSPNPGNREQLPAARAQPEQPPSVVDLILDKGLVIDAYI